MVTELCLSSSFRSSHTNKTEDVLSLLFPYFRRGKVSKNGFNSIFAFNSFTKIPKIKSSKIGSFQGLHARPHVGGGLQSP